MCTYTIGRQYKCAVVVNGLIADQDSPEHRPRKAAAARTLRHSDKSRCVCLDMARARAISALEVSARRHVRGAMTGPIGLRLGSVRKETAMETVLVTGAGGYIGTILVPMLLERDYRVRAIDRYFFGRELLPEHPRLE